MRRTTSLPRADRPTRSDDRRVRGDVWPAVLAKVEYRNLCIAHVHSYSESRLYRTYPVLCRSPVYRSCTRVHLQYDRTDIEEVGNSDYIEYGRVCKTFTTFTNAHDPGWAQPWMVPSPLQPTVMPHDIVSRILLALPVIDRLQALQLSHAWRVAGDDPASWTECDLLTRRDRWQHACWSAKIIRRSLAKAGASLTSLSVSALDDISEALGALRYCSLLVELRVDWHMQRVELMPSEPIPDLLQVLNWLPPPPFQLKRLHTIGMLDSWPAMSDDMRRHLASRSEWSDMAECCHCSAWGVMVTAGKIYDLSTTSTVLDRRLLFGSCAGTGCTKEWLCKDCTHTCDHCGETTCPNCVGVGAFECTTCHARCCSRCTDSSPAMMQVACAVASAHGATCAKCVAQNAVRRCERCGKAPCSWCQASVPSAIRICGGFCHRTMCEHCAGGWHYMMGVGLRRRPFCCQRCYDALSDADEEDDP